MAEAITPSARWATLAPEARAELEQSFRQTAIAAAAMLGSGGLAVWALLIRRRGLAVASAGGALVSYVAGTRLLAKSRELARFYGVLGDS